MLEEAHIENDEHEQERRRRGRCCQITLAWCYGFQDMGGWFKALWKLNDNQVQELCGTDYTLYLIFLRMSGILLLCTTGFNLCIMVPLYLTGDPLP